DEAWLSVGAGIHTGEAFVGAVGTGGVSQFTVLGDTPNTTARLASKAAGGEILVSETSAQQADIDVSALEHRLLELKGRAEPLGVYVLHVDTPLHHGTQSTVGSSVG
ncbi:MAG: adenylate/guanylate cyclase domain-containing protein, partial [Burkholderiales bacterium]|nr:adenylate/guanylate cyclase domain-containing protein [Anaerolineae bacterium]